MELTLKEVAAKLIDTPVKEFITNPYFMIAIFVIVMIIISRVTGDK